MSPLLPNEINKNDQNQNSERYSNTFIRWIYIINDGDSLSLLEYYCCHQVCKQWAEWNNLKTFINVLCLFIICNSFCGKIF